MILRSVQASAVGFSLREYLRDVRGLRDVRFASPLRAIPNGMEAYTFRLRLEGVSLPAEYRVPLVLRLYASAQGLPSLRHECAVQRHMAKVGFPVAKPVHIEEDSDFLGGPFMLMEQRPGRPLLDSLFAHPWEIFAGPFQMGALHARLHSLPTDGFPAPNLPFLARWLHVLQERIDMFELTSLQPGLDWLCDHRPPDPEVPSILHLDFHPINVLYERLGITAALDWPEADIGDAHADIATSLMLMETTSVASPNLMGRLFRPPGQILVRRFYRRAYGLKRSIDPKRLEYYGALAALRRLTRWGMWRCESPDVTGCKPDALALLAGDGQSAVEEYFRWRTGVAVRLHVEQANA